MRFLANENFPGPSIDFLIEQGVEVRSVARELPGTSDHTVMEIAIREDRTILTHDSDYGQLIFKHGYRPTAGVVYFRILDFEPDDPGKVLLELINTGHQFSNYLTVINENSIRQRAY